MNMKCDSVWVFSGNAAKGRKKTGADASGLSEAEQVMSLPLSVNA